MPNSISAYSIQLKGRTKEAASCSDIVTDEFIQSTVQPNSSGEPVFELGDVDKQFAKGKHGNITELLIYYREFQIDPIKFRLALIDTVNTFPILCGRRTDSRVVGNVGVRYSVVRVQETMFLARPTSPVFFARPTSQPCESTGTEVFSIRVALGQQKESIGHTCSSSIGVMWDHSICDVGGVSLLLQHLSSCYTSRTSQHSRLFTHVDRNVQCHLLQYHNQFLSPSVNHHRRDGGDMVKPKGVESVEWVYSNDELEELKLKWSAKTKHTALFCEIVSLLKGSCFPNMRTVSISVDKRSTLPHICETEPQLANLSQNHFGNTTFISVATLPDQTVSSDIPSKDGVDDYILSSLMSALDARAPCEVQLKEMADLHLTTWWHPLHPRTATLTGYNALSFGCEVCPQYMIGPNTTASAARICMNTGKPNVTILPSSTDDGLQVTLRIPTELASSLINAIQTAKLTDRITPKPFPTAVSTDSSASGNSDGNEGTGKLRSTPRSHTAYSWRGTPSIPRSHCYYSWQGHGDAQEEEEAQFALIWLHGLGDGGDTWKSKIKTLNSQHGSTLMYPKAPLCSVTANTACLSNSKEARENIPSWFDIHNLPLSLKEPRDVIGLEASVSSVVSMVEELVGTGLDARRIVIGGFSQGGAVALEVAKRLESAKVKLGGVVCISAWCIEEDVGTPAQSEKVSIEDRSNGDVSKTPVMFTYGSKDPLITLELSRHSCKVLGQLECFDLNTCEVERGSHMPKTAEMDKVTVFIKHCYSEGDDRFRSSLPCLKDVPTLPACLQNTLTYDTAQYPLYEATCSLLQRLKVGRFKLPPTTQKLPRLESFETHKTMGNFKNRFEFYKLVARDDIFLNQYDNFMAGVILPYIKSCLTSDDVKQCFHYQRPPTIRVQSSNGQGSAVHSDEEYGHQPGELNFWMPLTDYAKCDTTLWVESSPNEADFHPLRMQYGEIASFFGALCRHYVPDNTSPSTRVSLDFRVGVVPFFRPGIELNAKAQHTRREVYA